MERWEKQEVHKSYGTSILRIFFILPTFYVVFRLLHACNMTSFLYLMLLSTLSTVLVYSQSDCIFTVSDSGRNISYDLGSLRHSTHTVNDNDNAHLSYKFSICGNLTDKCSDDDNSNGCAQQLTDDSCTYRLGSWNDEPSAVTALNDSSGRYVSWCICQ